MMTVSENPGIICPSLNLLSPDQINDVHQYSVGILEDSGIKVESIIPYNSPLQVSKYLKGMVICISPGEKTGS